MFLVDVNILVYAVNADQDRHEVSRAWMLKHLNSYTKTVGFPWETITGFARIVTNPRIFPQPASSETAWGQIEEWLDMPGAWIPSPGPGHRRILTEIFRREKPTGQLVPDAHLAALAVEHGLKIASADTDFARFSSIQWIDPTRHP